MCIRDRYMPTNNYIDIMEKNHMEIPWHDYTSDDSNTLIKESGSVSYTHLICASIHFAQITIKLAKLETISNTKINFPGFSFTTKK